MLIYHNCKAVIKSLKWEIKLRLRLFIFMKTKNFDSNTKIEKNEVEKLKATLKEWFKYFDDASKESNIHWCEIQCNQCLCKARVEFFLWYITRSWSNVECLFCCRRHCCFFMFWFWMIVLFILFTLSLFLSFLYMNILLFVFFCFYLFRHSFFCLQRWTRHEFFASDSFHKFSFELKFFYIED